MSGMSAGVAVCQGGTDVVPFVVLDGAAEGSRYNGKNGEQKYDKWNQGLHVISVMWSAGCIA